MHSRLKYQKSKTLIQIKKPEWLNKSHETQLLEITYQRKEESNHTQMHRDLQNILEEKVISLKIMNIFR